MKCFTTFLFIIYVGFTNLAYAGVSLNSSIILFGEHDFNNCSRQVQKAITFGNTKLQLIPTLYADLNENQVLGYYYRDAKYRYQKVNHQWIKSFTDQMNKCIQYAYSKKIQITITPHLDDKDGIVWRNKFIFDPLMDYQGHSYYSIMLAPLAQVSSHKNLYLNLSGEMGTSLYNYPHSYIEIMNKLKSMPFKKGISLNYNNQFGSSHRFKKAIASFLKKLDFIGFSNYFSVPKYCTKGDFQQHLLRFLAPLYSYRKYLPKKIHMTEVGLGGNSSTSRNNFPAKTAYAAAQTPHSGIWGKYVLSNDPWKISSLKEMRIRYYNGLLSYLEVVKRRPKFHITHAFLWSLNSWDVQGLYSTSTKYRDHEISQSIIEHNQAN